MTDEQLTQLDRLVAVHVMGWIAGTDGWIHPETSLVLEEWQPTRDLNQCSEMDAVMLRKGWRIQVFIKPSDHDGPESISVQMWCMGEKAGEMIDVRVKSNDAEPLMRTLCHLKAVLSADFERTLKDAGVEV